VISFEALLELFWGGHDPRFASSSQYRAELYCANKDQLAAARSSAAVLESEIGGPIQTQIVSGKPFYPAEGYHQKWRLRRQSDLFDALLEHYDNEAELLASTAAAKLNAHVSGHWVHDGVDLEAFGLPTDLFKQVPTSKRPTTNPPPQRRLSP